MSESGNFSEMMYSQSEDLLVPLLGIFPHEVEKDKEESSDERKFESNEGTTDAASPSFAWTDVAGILAHACLLMLEFRFLFAARGVHCV
jgi:hypothetical protein